MEKNYLELFDPVTVKDLFSIMNSCSNNHRKADMVVKYLKDMKFKEVDLGTNIICMENKKYDDVVFKIALDPCGIEDNFNDVWLSEEIPEYSRVYAHHRTGIVSVHKRYKVFDSQHSIQRYHKQIMKLLRRLSKDYLIVDLSPINIKNYGTDKKGQLVIIDGSDMIKLNSGVSEFRCTELINKNNTKFKECGGELEYDEIFQYLVCKKCGKEVNPLTLKKAYSKEVNILKAKHFDTGLNGTQTDILNKAIQKRRDQQNINGDDHECNTSCGDSQEIISEMESSTTTVKCRVYDMNHSDEAVVSTDNNYDAESVKCNDDDDLAFKKTVRDEKPENQVDEDDDTDKISDDKVHLMDNAWWISYVWDEDSDEVGIILSKNKGTSWTTIHSINDLSNIMSVTISSCKNIVYVFVTRDLTTQGMITELVKLDPTKLVPSEVEEDEELQYKNTGVISDYEDQIRVSLSDPDKSINIEVDGEISILTRSSIVIRVSSNNDEDVEISAPEIFQLLNDKMN